MYHFQSATSWHGKLSFATHRFGCSQAKDWAQSLASSKEAVTHGFNNSGFRPILLWQGNLKSLFYHEATSLQILLEV
jgi:hypothetical protein